MFLAYGKWDVTAGQQLKISALQLDAGVRLFVVIATNIVGAVAPDFIWGGFTISVPDSSFTLGHNKLWIYKVTPPTTKTSDLILELNDATITVAGLVIFEAKV